MKITLILSAALLFNSMAIAQSKDEVQLTDAVETLRKLMVDPDEAALKNLLNNALTYGHSSGQLDSKEKFVSDLMTGKSNFEKIELSDQSLKIVGRTACVNHVLNADTNNAGGTPGKIKLSILTVWIKQKSGWKLLARQATKTP